MAAFITLILLFAVVVGIAATKADARKSSGQSRRRSRTPKARRNWPPPIPSIPSIREKRARNALPLKFKNKRMLTANEKEFFLRLKEALPNHHVMAQVAMASLVDVENWGSESHPGYWARRAKFDKLIIDFVVLSDSLEVVTLIELDDCSHDSKKEKDRDRDDMVAAAGYPTIRYQSVESERPSVQTIAANVAYVEQELAKKHA